jgi:two-component system chemotaxis response regulator CheB
MEETIDVLLITPEVEGTGGLAHAVAETPPLNLRGVATDSFSARDMLLGGMEKPVDVVLLDLDTPKMNHTTFVRKVMRYSPVPVVVTGSFSFPDTASLAIKVLEAGAVEAVEKLNIIEQSEKSIKGVGSKIENAARINRDVIRSYANTDLLDKPNPLIFKGECNKVVGIGAGTGGLWIITLVLNQLPSNGPAVVIALNLPKGLPKALADFLNSVSELEVKEAEEGDPILPGKAFIAPHGVHTAVELDSKGEPIIRLREGPCLHCYCCPSADVLFNSLANNLKDKAIGVLLSGGVDDGAIGLARMKKAGSTTVVQAKEGCPLFTTPEKAIALGASEIGVVPDKLAETVLKHAK